MSLRPMRTRESRARRAWSRASPGARRPRRRCATPALRRRPEPRPRSCGRPSPGRRLRGSVAWRNRARRWPRSRTDSSRSTSFWSCVPGDEADLLQAHAAVTGAKSDVLADQAARGTREGKGVRRGGGQLARERSVRGLEEDRAPIGQDLVEVHLVFVDAEDEGLVRSRERGRRRGHRGGRGAEGALLAAAGTRARFTVPFASPVAGRKSGSASPRMNTKMNNTATMMKMPPKVMTPTASRSRSLTRRMREPCAARRSRMLAAWAGGAAAAIGSLSVSQDLRFNRTLGPGGIPPGPRIRDYSILASSCFTISAGRGR